MEQITFTFDNIRAIEAFTDSTLYSYFNIGTPSAVFKSNCENRTETHLVEGEILFKDKDNNLFKKIN